MSRKFVKLIFPNFKLIFIAFYNLEKADVKLFTYNFIEVVKLNFECKKRKIQNFGKPSYFILYEEMFFSSLKFYVLPDDNHLSSLFRIMSAANKSTYIISGTSLNLNMHK